jgi:hypothetical protein
MGMQSSQVGSLPNPDYAACLKTKRRRGDASGDRTLVLILATSSAHPRTEEHPRRGHRGQVTVMLGGATT